MAISEEDRQPASTTRSFGLPDAVLIGAVPLLGYAVGYAYEFGYARYFGIPAQFVSIGLAHIFLATAALLGVSGLVFMPLNLGYLVLRPYRLSEPLKARIARMSMGLVVALGLFWLGSGALAWWRAAAVVLAMMGFFEFLFPLITQRRVRGYEAKLKAQDDIDYGTRSLLDTGIGRVGPTNGLSSEGV